MNQRFLTLLREHCALEEKEITPETPLESLSLDSLSFIALLVGLEEEFGVEFEDEELLLSAWERVGELQKRIEEKEHGT